jgi:hypothetical protein
MTGAHIRPRRLAYGEFLLARLADAGLDPAVVLHKATLPSVVLSLPAPGEPPALKRNLRESLRRSRNRLHRLPGEWTVDRVGPGDPGWVAALEDLRRLHGERARMSDVVVHGDVFAGTSQAALLQAVAERAGRSRPRVLRLLHDGVAVAALLTVASDRRTWLSVSGVAPEHWALSAVTLLQWEAVQEAARAGHEAVVLSTGVDTAKLRWSEHVRVSHVFVVVHPRRRSRTVFRLYWLLRSHLHLRREERRFAVRRPTGARP